MLVISRSKRATKKRATKMRINSTDAYSKHKLYFRLFLNISIFSRTEAFKRLYPKTASFFQKNFFIFFKQRKNKHTQNYYDI